MIQYIKIDNEKIYKNNLENEFKEINVGLQDNPNKMEVHIKLNDVEVYWLSKLNIVLIEMNISVQNLIFSVDKEYKDKINLDVLSKKLRSVIPNKRISSQEIENIITCLDFNKNKEISLKELEDVLQLSNSDKTLRKTQRESVCKPDQLKRSSLAKEIIIQKSLNLKDLPVKGNIEVINNIKQYIIRSKTEQSNIVAKLASKEEIKINNTLTQEYDFKPVESLPANESKQYTEFNKVHILRESSKKMEIVIKKKSTIQIDSEDKKYFGIKDQKINTENIIVNENLIREVLKEIDLIDEGQELLINLLENNVTFDDFGKNAVFNVFNMFLKFFPLVERGKLFEISKCIDTNKDGFIEINDLIQFLLNYMNYKSSKLASKAILFSTKNNSTLEERFIKDKMKIENEISFVDFLKFFNKNFNFDPPILKKLYDEIKVQKAKNTLQVVDIIDFLNEFEKSEESHSGNKIIVNNKLNILEMKSFAIEIKKFVKSYIETYGKPFGGNDYNLPPKINLETFRQFIKDAKINFQLGMSIFYLIKSFSNNRNEYFIMKDDLFEFLNSYKGEIEPLSIEKIVENLESFGCPLKFCIANLPNKMDSVPTNELESALKKCYPNFSNEVLNKIVLELNEGTKVNISLGKIQDFLMKYTKYGVKININ